MKTNLKNRAAWIAALTAVSVLAGAGTARALADVELGSRPLSMGGAATAGALGTDAVFWNAAALSEGTAAGLALTHGVYPGLSGVSLDAFSFHRPSRTWGFGAAWAQASSRLEQGATAEKTRFTDSTGLIAIGGRLPMLEGAFAGGTVRWSSVAGSAGGDSSFALDLSARYQPPSLDWLVAGASVRGLAGVAPLAMRLGAQGEFLAESALRVGLEFEAKRDIRDKAGVSPKIHAGAEYRLLGLLSALPEIALRAGYESGGPSLGLGLSRGGFRLDYAAALARSYGAHHRVTLAYSPPLARRPAPASPPPPAPVAEPASPPPPAAPSEPVPPPTPAPTPET